MKFSEIILEASYRDESEAELRRETDEWALGPDCPEEGLKAHALKEVLPYSFRTEEQNQRLREVKELLDELNDSDTDSEQIQNQIETLENEKEELESEKDVYDLIPIGNHYDMTLFEVRGESEEWAVGTYDEIYESTKEYLESAYSESGPNAFRKGFAEYYIDEEKVVDTARDFYSDDVYQNPEVYIDDSQRNLSNRQEENISIWESRIEEIEDLIERLEDLKSDDERKNVSVDEKIEELNEQIEELQQNIQDETDSPNGDFPDELIEERIEDMLEDVRSEPKNFLRNFGYEISDYIDEEKLIEAVIDSDGFVSMASYDGNVEEVTVQGKDFYLVRID